MVNAHDCSQCRRTFSNEDALHAHCVNKKDHYYCSDCRRLFFQPRFLEQHLNSSVHVKNGGGDPATCYICHKDFYSWQKMKSHCTLKRSDHFLCVKECGEIFTTVPLLQEHMRKTLHHPPRYDSYDTFRCKECSVYFQSKALMDNHLTLKHNWCFICAQGFEKKRHLLDHIRSIAHKARTIKCALCPQLFKEPSSIAHHIESGECTPGLTRHHVAQAIQALKVKPSILITEDDTLGTSDVSEIFSSATSVSASNALSLGTVTAEVATEDAFNGVAYECPKCEKTFKTLLCLNRHITSAAHDDDMFKCPDCSTTFTLCSGLIQHLESESCGAASIVTVEKEANLVTAQFAKLLCGA